MNLLNFIFKPAKRIEDEVTVARMEALRKATMRAQPPDSIIGGRIKVQESGWSLEIPKSSGGSAATIQPHEVISVGADKITINNGTVNNLITLPIREIAHEAVDDFRYLVVQIDLSEESGPTGSTYLVLTDPPDAIEWSTATMPTQINVLIAVLKNKQAFQVRSGNFNVSRVIAHEVPKDSVSVGEYPNEIYWTWEVT